MAIAARARGEPQDIGYNDAGQEILVETFAVDRTMSTSGQWGREGRGGLDDAVVQTSQSRPADYREREKERSLRECSDTACMCVCGSAWGLLADAGIPDATYEYNTLRKSETHAG